MGKKKMKLFAGANEAVAKVQQERFFTAWRDALLDWQQQLKNQLTLSEPLPAWVPMVANRAIAETTQGSAATGRTGLPSPAGNQPTMNSLQTARRLLATFQELPSIFSRPPLNLALASKLAKCNAASRATTEKARKALQGNKILQILTNCLLHRRWAVGLKHKRPPSGDRCLRFAPASPPRLWLPTLPESWLQFPGNCPPPV